MISVKFAEDAVRINDALRFIGEIEEIYSPNEPMDKQRLMAICYGILIVGEALNHVSKETQSAHPHIKWRQITDTRNRLVHGYGTVDKEMMADIAYAHLPQLKLQLLNLLNSYHP